MDVASLFLLHYAYGGNLGLTQTNTVISQFTISTDLRVMKTVNLMLNTIFFITHIILRLVPNADAIRNKCLYKHD